MYKVKGRRGGVASPFEQNFDMQALHPLIQDQDNAATRDNAAGAVGRMLSSMPSHLPLDQVLPVLLSKQPTTYLPVTLHWSQCVINVYLPVIEACSKHYAFCSWLSPTSLISSFLCLAWAHFQGLGKHVARTHFGCDGLSHADCCPGLTYLASNWMAHCSRLHTSEHDGLAKRPSTVSSHCICTDAPSAVSFAVHLGST